jgi:NAD(P)-dependent dehydrogenase (short-subunit alcohol dehydrogenase family)
MPACPINRVLKSQKAIVTGGSFGIGKAGAIALGHAGADVVVNYISRPDAAEEVVLVANVADGGACVDRALASLPLHRINPFRLIGIFPHQREVAEWRWDLQQLRP